MNYEKMTLERFAENLKSDRYKNLTGARRALGKVDWSNADRERGQALASKHFGEPVKAEKAAKKAVKAAKAEKVKVAKVAKPAKVVEKAAPKKVGRPAKASSPDKEYQIGMVPRDFNKLQILHTSAQIISAGSAAIEAMQRAKLMDQNLDVSEGQAAINLIASAVNQLHGVMGSTAPHREEEPTPQPPAAEPTNGHSKLELSDEDKREQEIFARKRSFATPGPGSLE